ncbi:hypothetical protein Avbf_14388 [Armadillidium vulgare]|nr:hypothetical protein Avbf_14388 [Armadillidium vulgare]
MSFKNYICFFTFSLFVSAMADPYPSQFDFSEQSLAELAPLVDDILPYLESFEAFIDDLPELIEDVMQKFTKAFDLANEGKLDEAKDVVKSIPLVGDYAYEFIQDVDVNDVEQLNDSFQTFLKNYDIEI